MHIIVSMYRSNFFSSNLLKKLQMDRQIYKKNNIQLFSLELKCHTFISLNRTLDCWIYLPVLLVRINIWQYG